MLSLPGGNIWASLFSPSSCYNQKPVGLLLFWVPDTSVSWVGEHPGSPAFCTVYQPLYLSVAVQMQYLPVVEIFFSIWYSDKMSLFSLTQRFKKGLHPKSYPLSTLTTIILGICCPYIKPIPGELWIGIFALIYNIFSGIILFFQILLLYLTAANTTSYYLIKLLNTICLVEWTKIQSVSCNKNPQRSSHCLRGGCV